MKRVRASGPACRDILAFWALLLATLQDGACEVNWSQEAQDTLIEALNQKQNWGVAQNVILMIGDGMGISTVTTSRIYDGQNHGRPGEEHMLSVDKFPHVALSKTYDATHQVADSSATATAMMCGSKSPTGTVGMTQYAERGKCKTNADENQPLTQTSILNWSLDKGKSVGLVTTARITHATPASAYAQSPDRNWESDGNIPKEAVDACAGDPLSEDIASQLVTRNPSIKVILGGGRRSFFNSTEPDLEYGFGKNGTRSDGRNLVEEWEAEKQARGASHAFVWNNTEFQKVDPLQTEYLLGLFEPSHMQYELDRQTDEGGEPSLTEMVTMAIRMLSMDKDGFFLMVESGRIDHAHHDTNAKRALNDTVEFMSAIQKAVDLTNDKDTLIVVTADHSHVFTMGGYSRRGNPILGTVDADAVKQQPAYDNATYLTLMYANGPGPTRELNLSEQDTGADDFLQTVAVQTESETHGGEDVAIYARGPMSHLFYGTHEQNYIAHVMAYASCVGANQKHCEEDAVHDPCAGNGSQSRDYMPLAVMLTVIVNMIARITSL